MTAWLIRNLEDLLLLLGACLIVRGVALVSIPAAWIVSGILLIAFAFMLAKEKNAASEKLTQ